METNGIAALAQRILQQSPLALCGGQSAYSGVWPTAVWCAPQDAFPGVEGPPIKSPYVNGTMWSATGHEFTSSGKDTGLSIGDTVDNFVVNRYYRWYFPSGAQCKQLAARAMQAAANARDPKTGQPAPVTGSNAIPYGLMQLGLLSEANYNKSPDKVLIYCNYGGSSLEVYDSQNGSVGGNGVGDNDDFRPQGGDLAIVLLVRPFPGAPQDAEIDMGQGANNPYYNLSAPSYIQNSQTWSELQNATNGQYYVNAWQSDVALAGSLPPSEIVVAQDGNDPHQLRAFALWPVACDNHINGGGGNVDSYIVYTEVTDLVEWLSSDPSAADVSSFASQNSTVVGGTVTGATIPVPLSSPTPLPTPSPSPNTIGGAGVTIVSPVINGTTISGGTIANFVTLSGSVAGGTIIGNTAFPNPFASGQLSGGTITAGTLTSPGTTYTLLSTDGMKQATILTGATIANATVVGGAVAVAGGGHGGRVTVHDPTRPVTFTASWMTNANTSTTTNTTAATWSFLTNPEGNPPQITFPAGSFSDTPTLVSTVISPNNLQVTVNGSGTVNQNFYLTGYYSDGSAKDLTSTATWQVYVPEAGAGPPVLGPGNAAFFSTVPLSTNVLQFPPGFNYTGNLFVTATVAGGPTASALIDVIQ
jgi:hypothetical protein